MFAKLRDLLKTTAERESKTSRDVVNETKQALAEELQKVRKSMQSGRTDSATD